MPDSATISRTPPAPASRPSAAAPWCVVLAVAVIVLAAFAAYHGSLSAPFVFDDQLAIVNNPTIRDLRAIGEVLDAATPNGAGVRGRPLINLSLALNYAAGGLEVRGYHAFNLAVHVLAGLALFGLIRRTLDGDRCRTCLTGGISSDRRPHVAAGASRVGWLGDAAFLPALVVALLWTLHPLQSETVICPVQRTESLMGLCYLLTLYLVVRGVASARPGSWFGAAVAACLAGMACKEVMVSAPLMVLLYDRTFLSGSFRDAWRRRRSLYIGLGSTWVLLGFLVIYSGGQRGGTVGFGLGVSSWDYALTQCRAVMLYFRLSVWPHPLVADYGSALVTRLGEVLPQTLVLVCLGIGTTVALWRRPLLGFVGAWFFAILAPSSSVLPLTSQTIAEHRMYLPLAAVIGLAVVAAHRACGRPGLVAFLGLAAAFGGLTAQRGEAYRSELGFWSEVVTRQPDNPRAHYNLGCLLDQAGRKAEAISRFEEALRLKPGFAEAHLNLGNALNRAGRVPEAIKHYEEALRLKPDYALADYLLAETLEKLGRSTEAIRQYLAALEIQPDFANAHNKLGQALYREGRISEAMSHYETAVRLDPASVEASYHLAIALAGRGRMSEAIRQCEATLAINPNSAEAHNNLGRFLAQALRLPEAIAQWREAVRLQPDFVEAHDNLAGLLLILGKADEAATEYALLLRLRPDDASARAGLDRARAAQTSASAP